jgi:hypothetical protein
MSPIGLPRLRQRALLPLVKEARAQFQLEAKISMAEESQSSKPGSDQSRRFQRVRKRLRLEFGDDLYAAWFSRLELTRASDGEALLAAPTKFMKLWIETHFLKGLRACVIAEFNDIDSVSIAAAENPVAPHAPLGHEGMATGGSMAAGD